ncbi:hypothetical protein [Acinetobacter gyllenbergii]|uniref:hypothetical protein n=1 Tax=Acinetobacter gyllenbergii TaxID=134534 RepID=UPI003F56B2C2
MTFNKISSVVILSGFLMACDGDNSEVSDSIQQKDEILNTSFDNTTSYNWASIQFNSTFVEISKNTRNADILYTDYQKLDSKSQPDFGRLMLSKDGLYTPDETKYPLGYRRFNLRSVSQDGTILRKTPYNYEKHKALVIEEEGRWIDLKNVKVSDRTAVYWNLLAQKIPSSVFFSKDTLGTQFKNFLALTRQTTFPTGAKCFKVEKTTYSTPFYGITDLNTTFYDGFKYVNSLNDYISALGRNAVTGTWGTTQWAYSKQTANDPKYYSIDVYMNINNNLARGYYTKDPNSSIESLVKDYEISLKQSIGYDDKVSFTGAIEQVKNECTYYNSVAAQKIESLIDATLKN